LIFSFSGVKISVGAKQEQHQRRAGPHDPYARITEIIVGAWTFTHFYQIAPTLLVSGILSVLAAKALGKCHVSKKYIPLKVIAVLLIVLEAAKQINAVGTDGTYDLYALPFHYCSLFLYLLPLHAFYRGKHRHIVDAATFGCLASLTMLMLLMPAVIYSEESIKGFFMSFGDFHTVIFHHLVILYFMLTVTLKLYELRTVHDLAVISVFLTVYVSIATILSYSLKVNFHNLYRCNIAFIEEMRLAVIARIGMWGSVFYVGILFILTILFAYASYFLARLVIKTLGAARKMN